MTEIGERIDNRAGSMFGKIDNVLVGFCPTGNHVDIGTQDPAEVLDRFSLSPAGILAQENALPSQLIHAGFKAHSRP